MMQRALWSVVAVGWILALSGVAGGDETPREDILLADFEGPDYGDWQATGEAFGPGPARGTLPHQMPVSGYLGQGLVNTYYQGDDTTGTLTSPAFRVERRFISFLIGGGKHPGKTCINLLVDGKVVRTATGPNDRPGGSERLEWHNWDVAELEGQTAVIQIVDQQQGGWGHINIDHILMTDRPKVPEAVRRQMLVERRYLHLPVQNDAPQRLVSLLVDGQLVRQFNIELAEEGQPDYWVFLDLSEWRGKSVVVEAQLMGGSKALDRLQQSDQPLAAEDLYRETYRPQFHFSPRRGWMNDPNGLVFYQGEYHLFFQHNPYSTKWNNMTWGHAVSPDLIHWTELDDAIHPDRLGTIFSGSAVVDWHNTAGFQTGPEKVLVCIYTSAGGTSAWSVGQPFTQSIAYSNDRGRTWTKYAGNPVLGHIIGHNRDPKVIWHAPTKQWIMVLYLNGNNYGFFASADLKTWRHLHDLSMPECAECPDFFPMPVEGSPETVRWVFTAANGRYLIGDFDGQRFTVESGPYRADWGGNYYAVQTFSDIPASDGRRIQVAWMNGGNYPGMPFNQQMGIPCEMTLRRLPEGLRICRNPVREVQSLRVKTHQWHDLVVQPDQNPLPAITAQLLDIEAEIELGQATEVGLEVRGQRLSYSVKDRKLGVLGGSADLAPVDNRIRLRVLVDRTSVEVFGNDGQVPMSFCWLPDPNDRRLGVYAVGGTAKFVRLAVHELRSAWPQ